MQEKNLKRIRGVGGSNPNSNSNSSSYLKNPNKGKALIDRIIKPNTNDSVKPARSQENANKRRADIAYFSRD